MFETSRRMQVTAASAHACLAVAFPVLLHVAISPDVLAKAEIFGPDVASETGEYGSAIEPEAGGYGYGGPMPAPGPGEEGDVRLVSRIDANGYATGGLQAFIGGDWGAVCNSGLDDRDAQVACRQLGFSAGMVLGPTNTGLTERQTDPEVLAPFVLENLGCVGDEEAILECPLHDQSEIDYVTLGYRYNDYSYVNPAKCDPYSNSYALLACGLGNGAAEGSVRLAGGAKSPDGRAEYGRLEVAHRGGWGTVCDRLFTRSGKFVAAAADVVCKELGYTEGARMQTVVDEEAAPTERVPVVLSGAACVGNETALAQCPGVDLDADNNNCGHGSDVWLVCSSGPQPEIDGQLRLADGQSGPGYEYGRLEVFLQGFWSNICGRFTPDSANVACSGLGFDGGSKLRFIQPYATRFTSPSTLNQVLTADVPVALAAVDCAGNESSLLDCQNNPELVSFCDTETSSTVVACSNTAAGCDKEANTTEGAVRLRGGFGTPCDPLHSGFVEVRHNGTWGAICRPTFADDLDDPLDNLVADVVCRQLGFSHGTRVDPLTARPPRGSDDEDYLRNDYDYIAEEAEEPLGRFFLTDVECNGPESALVDCDLGSGFQTTGTRCIWRGRSRRLHVACRSFPVPEALEAVSTPDTEEGDLRLVNETAIANWVTGQLQVFFEGSWGQVCEGAFEAPDANVACRQLGYGAGSIVPPNLDEADRAALRDTAVFPEVVISSSGCSGNEERLLDCPMQEQRRSDEGRKCRDSTSAGLRLACVANPISGKEGAVRLAGQTADATPGSEVGTLEIFHAGAWGTICGGRTIGFRSYYDAPAISDQTAEVACRDAGFNTGAFVSISDAAVDAAPPPWLASVRCDGTEAGVAGCEAGEFGQTAGCGPLLSLACSSSMADNGRARLTGGRADPGGAWEYGRLEVLVSGAWSILEDIEGGRREPGRLGLTGAQVACRSLGYATGAQILAGISSPLVTDDTAIVGLRDIACGGSEAALGDCEISYVRAYETDYGYPYDEVTSLEGVSSVVLVCASPSDCQSGESSDGPATPEEGDIRLVPLLGAAAATAPCDAVHFGGLEIFHDGRWGRICSGDFRQDPEEFVLDAQVACRELGFPFGTVMETFGNQPDEPIDVEDGEEVVWATQVVCRGTEERLRDCAFPENFADDRGVFQRCLRGDLVRLGVVCRRFGIPESAVIR